VHLTLKFLGNVPVAEIEPLGEALMKAVKRLSSFELRLGKVGAFPERGSPRLVWVGLEGEVEALRQLHEHVAEAVAGIGSDSNEDRFSPHITLGRVRPDRRVSLASAPDLEHLDSFVVSSVSLMRSELSPRGARYSRLALLPLGKRQAGLDRLSTSR
jgi:2'-5' RNA ligase